MHSPFGAVDAGEVGAIAPRGTPAGVVLEQQGVLARTALVGRLAPVVHDLTPTGVTARDGAAGLKLQGACMG